MNTKNYPSPVRLIGLTNRSVSGVVPEIGQYESALERDFMELSRFDDSIEKILPQPLTIGYRDNLGNDRTYTPDGLIFYRADLNLPPVLYEIKYRADFRLGWRKLLPKFRAAKCIASARGFVFKVFTEREIRTSYLDNVKFLWPYKQRVVESEVADHVLTLLSDLEEADPELLLMALCNDERNRGLMIPVIWHLVACFRIGCDLDKPLTMQSVLWCKEDV